MWKMRRTNSELVSLHQQIVLQLTTAGNHRENTLFLSQIMFFPPSVYSYL